MYGYICIYLARVLFLFYISFLFILRANRSLFFINVMYDKSAAAQRTGIEEQRCLCSTHQEDVCKAVGNDSREKRTQQRK